MKTLKRYNGRKTNGKIRTVEVGVSSATGRVRVVIYRDHKNPTWCDDGSNRAVYGAFANVGRAARLLRRGAMLLQGLAARAKIEQDALDLAADIQEGAFYRSGNNPAG